MHKPAVKLAMFVKRVHASHRKLCQTLNGHTLHIVSLLYHQKFYSDCTCAWYFKSFLIFPVVKFHTSINPSALPVTRYCPSGENWAHSGYDFDPNLIVLFSRVGYFSSSRSFTAARPLNSRHRQSVWPQYIPRKFLLSKYLHWCTEQWKLNVWKININTHYIAEPSRD